VGGGTVDHVQSQLDIGLEIPFLGMRATVRRSMSSVQVRGKYSSKSIGTCSPVVALLKLTPIWQSVTLPAEPVYCRWTSTDSLSCLRKPVSSTTQTRTCSCADSPSIA
jgi:hypothetical protein